MMVSYTYFTKVYLIDSTGFGFLNIPERPLSRLWRSAAKLEPNSKP